MAGALSLDKEISWGTWGGHHHHLWIWMPGDAFEEASAPLPCVK